MKRTAQQHAVNILTAVILLGVVALCVVVVGKALEIF